MRGRINLKPRYDAIVIGARVAGAATEMLLACAGLRVLVVDRSAYGSVKRRRNLLRSIRGNMDIRRFELETLTPARALKNSYCSLAHGFVLRRKF